MITSMVRAWCHAGCRCVGSTLESRGTAVMNTSSGLSTDVRCEAAASIPTDATACHTDSGNERDLDPQQVRLLDEMCLLVDENDRQIGTASKRHCHRWQRTLGGGGGSCPLHRAFSVFLFNSRDELLLQQRSHYKITFPGHYTNTCCSHPLAVPDEQITDNALGVINAARRRLNLELGIPHQQVPVSCFTYLTRVLYSSESPTLTTSSSPTVTTGWGEHEIDYILIVRGVDAQPRPDPGEVLAWRYVSLDELPEQLRRLREADVPLTPWFSRLLASEQLLPAWWRHLHQLQPFVDHTRIHRLS